MLSYAPRGRKSFHLLYFKLNWCLSKVEDEKGLQKRLGITMMHVSELKSKKMEMSSFFSPRKLEFFRISSWRCSCSEVRFNSLASLSRALSSLPASELLSWTMVRSPSRRFRLSVVSPICALQGETRRCCRMQILILIWFQMYFIGQVK